MLLTVKNFIKYLKESGGKVRLSYYINMTESSNLEEEIEKLSHEDRLEITQSSLRRLIAADPLLQDLPGDVTTEEVLSQIAVAQGQSITVTILRHSETPLLVVVGCTNWKRVFMVLTDKSNATNLWDIPANIAHANSSTLKISNLPKLEALSYLNNFTSFLMVRHPFERLLSAFRNKLEDQSESAKYFQTRIGRYIVKKYRPNATSDEIKSGKNITFREFAQYLIREGVTNELANEHWMPVNDLCQPCLINYTFIGKYEWFEEDTRTVLDMVGAPYIDFPVSKPNYTRDKLRFYFQQLSLSEIEDLYNLYKLDFKLFGYDLNPILGFEIG
ncbi:carbohydrate sulfotransferase 11 isoform X2 [Agrilus planipennis]|uniref:Carbohydrate sulfotransferase n=2 Tax=Agrilus planipennis TaxID=224129 RepID=A0A7F5RE55_AGRPL|nr:carbohydrate sulfotransferase 11 isoform X2 [Agrilus planipennis]